MPAVESANRTWAAAIFAPVPALPFTEQIVSNNGGVESFERLSAGQYRVTLVQPVAFVEAEPVIGLPPQLQAYYGAQVEPAGTVFVSVFAGGTGLPLDPPWLSFSLLSFREGVGPGPAVPVPAPPAPFPTPVTPIVQFSADDAVYPVGSGAVAGVRNNHPLVVFPQGADGFIDLQGVANHQGFAIVRILWCAPVNVGDVNWLVSWERDNALGVDMDVDSFAAAKTIVSAAPPLTQLRQASILFNQAESGGLLVGDAYRIRIRRQAGVAPDTMAADAQLYRVLLEVP